MSLRYRRVRYRDIEVVYLPELEGGGIGFGQTFVPIVRELFGKVGRVHEFCAGPGFIGFSLLAHGLCDSLCLSDINPVAVAAARETVRRNRLEDKVSVYLLFRGRGPYLDSYYFLWLCGQAMASRPSTRPRLLTSVEGPAAVVPLRLSADRPARLHLERYRRYRFAFDNRLGKRANVVVYAKKALGILPQFLRSVMSVEDDRPTESFTFQMFPGRYDLRDAGSRRALASIHVD
jgi:hypothetical protein